MLTRSPAIPAAPVPPVRPDPASDGALPEPGDGEAARQPLDGEPSLGRRLRDPRTLISFGLAAAILWFVVRRLDVDPAAIWAQIRQANPLLLAVAFLLWYGAFFVRGWRWRGMLRGAELGGDIPHSLPSVPRLAEIVLLGFFANSLAPAKLGDAYRAYLLKRESGVPFSAGLGAILAERLVDALMLVVVLAGSAFVVFGRQLPPEAAPALSLGGFLVIAGTFGLAVMWFTRDILARLLPLRLQDAYTRLHAAVFGALRRPALVFGIGLVIWFGDGLRVWFVARSLNAEISPAVAVFVAVFGALLTVIPFTPAGLGVVELGVGSILVGVLGLDPVVAGSIILLDRVVAYWSLLLVGGVLYAWRTRRELREQPGVAPP